jgi:hypothetical protein
MPTPLLAGEEKMQEEIALTRINTVLEIFFSDPCFFPKYQDMEDLNPTHDPIKRKMHKIESAWDWRNRVIKCFRTQDKLYPSDWPRESLYMAHNESCAFWGLYLKGKWNDRAKIAIGKIDKLMEHWGVYWE